MKKNSLMCFTLLATICNFSYGFSFSSLFKECYDTELQLKAKYERCADLGMSYAPIIKQNVWTFVCSTKGGDKYLDFIVSKDGKLCRTGQIDARN
jgi:hypothetical protein